MYVCMYVYVCVYMCAYSIVCIFNFSLSPCSFLLKRFEIYHLSSYMPVVSCPCTHISEQYGIYFHFQRQEKEPFVVTSLTFIVTRKSWNRSNSYWLFHDGSEFPTENINKTEFLFLLKCPNNMTLVSIIQLRFQFLSDVWKFCLDPSDWLWKDEWMNLQLD